MTGALQRVWWVVFPALLAAPASAQVGPDGIDWVTIGAINNPAYDREDPNGSVSGRGSVGYEYRMGRCEVTTAQWLEFYNAFKARPDSVPDSVLPPPITGLWGAQTDPTYSGPGVRYREIPGDPNSGMRFAGGITWRTAAMYCNWLHNGKSTSLTAIQSGAYDTSTFGETAPNHFTDQVTRSPGARYWIPSLDEWIKASFFDPSANGGQGGWWLNQYGRDRAPVYAPPPSIGGNGESNTFFQLADNGQYRIPLGAYASVWSVSPWGLLDTAGATSEWTEERIVEQLGRVYRVQFGSSSAIGGNDFIYGSGAGFPNARHPWEGFRIASSIPSPASGIVLLGAVCLSASPFGRTRGSYE